MFGWIDTDASTPAALAAAAGCKTEPLKRPLSVLVRLDLIHRSPDGLAAVYFSANALTEHGLKLLNTKLTIADILDAARVTAQGNILTV